MPMEYKAHIHDFLAEAGKPLVVVLGPTASGKTGLSIEIASYLSELDMTAEVVNADSRQLYRGMDIGTAKITPEEMSGVPHHLFDVLDPNEEATVGWYKKQAGEVIDQLLAKEKIPVLVGGSMLYISAIIDDLTLAPVGDPALRAEIEKVYDEDAGKALYQRLQVEDPEAAQRLHQNNKPRLVRAIEILELTNGPRSRDVPDTELQASRQNKSEEQESTCPYDVLILGVDRPREELHQRINQRAEMMFNDGWMKEVQHLLDAGYKAEDPGMKSHGYKEIMEYLQSDKSEPLEELRERIAAKTRQYARRQQTWWKGDKRIHWLTPRS